MSRYACGPLGAFILVTALIAAGRADPALRLAPQKGVLLLRSGQVIAGTITPAGDYYLVSLPHGEIRVPSGKVDAVCRDLDDAYKHKKSRVELGKAADHVALADWCLQNGLLELADRELSYALAADATFPRIRLVERRLEMARREATPAMARAKPAQSGPTNEELDRMIRGMAPGTVEQFTSTIQPLLVNTCTASGCHLPQTGAKMHLMRVPANSPPSRRTTQRNLYSVWRQIDLANPAASPLLTAPLEQHGNAKAAMFSDHEAEQYRLLANWVSELSRGRKPSQPASVAKPSSTLLQTMPPAAGRGATPAAGAKKADRTSNGKPQESAADIDLVSYDEASEGADQSTGDDPPSAGKPKKRQPPKPLEIDFEPVDPFDPEIFNRRYHPRESE